MSQFSSRLLGTAALSIVLATQIATAQSTENAAEDSE